MTKQALLVISAALLLTGCFEDQSYPSRSQAWIACKAWMQRVEGASCMEETATKQFVGHIGSHLYADGFPDNVERNFRY